MSVVRWNPYGEMMSLRQAMDRLLEESFIQPRGLTNERDEGGMELDVMEREDVYVIRASMPGVKPEDINVTMERGLLTIRGDAHQEEEQTEGRYYRRERRTSRYARSIALPGEVNAGACDASYEHGVLTITLPKAEHEQANRIAVRGQPSHSTGQPVIEAKSDANKSDMKNRTEKAPSLPSRSPKTGQEPEGSILR
jgi:HSP20 family protein